MPNRLAMAEAANWLAVLDDIGDDVEFRDPLYKPTSGFLDGREIKLAEAFAEGINSESVRCWPRNSNTELLSQAR